MDSDVRDADRWWSEQTERRRVQIHRMMDRDAGRERVPEEQLLLVPAGEGR